MSCELNGLIWLIGSVIIITANVQTKLNVSTVVAFEITLLISSLWFMTGRIITAIKENKK